MFLGGGKGSVCDDDTTELTLAVQLWSHEAAACSQGQARLMHNR